MPGPRAERSRRRLPPVIGMLAALSVLAVALGGAAAERDGGGAPSPEALLARVRTAAAGDVVGVIVCCLAPDDRVDIALELVIAAGVAVDFLRAELPSMIREMERGFAPRPRTAEQQAAVDAASAEVAARVGALAAGFDRLLQRHGLPVWLKPGQEPPPEVADPRTTVRAMVGALDQAALLRDVLAYLDELGLGHRREELGGRLAEPWRGGASVSDLRIEGDEATGRMGATPVQMVRRDGRWYLRRPLGP